MAHAGFWAFGGASVGLVAAGLWLNGVESPPEPAAPTRAAETAPEPVPPVPIAETEPAPQSEVADAPADPEPTVATETGAKRPPPVGLLSRVDGPGGILWTHDAMRVVPPESAEAVPNVAVDAPLPAELPVSADQTAIAYDGLAVLRDELMVYSGPPVWNFLPQPGLPESVQSVLRSGFQNAQSLHYFGAIAMGTEVAPVYLAQGFATILAAEQAAMDTCTREATGCRLVAHLTPSDFDGRQGDTLTHGQGLRWHAFHDLPMAHGAEPAFRAIAMSEDGGVGTSDHTSAEHARQEALDECRKSRVRNRTGIDAQTECRFIAERASPGTGARSPPALGGLPETETGTRN